MKELQDHVTNNAAGQMAPEKVIAETIFYFGTYFLTMIIWLCFLDYYNDYNNGYKIIISDKSISAVTLIS